MVPERSAAAGGVTFVVDAAIVSRGTRPPAAARSRASVATFFRSRHDGMIFGAPRHAVVSSRDFQHVFFGDRISKLLCQGAGLLRALSQCVGLFTKYGIVSRSLLAEFYDDR